MCLNSAGNFIKPEPDIAKTLQEFAEVRGPGTSAHMRRLLPKGSLGLVFKTRFSSLNTFHPWTKVSVVVCTDATLVVKTFLPVTSLVCVVIVANPLQQRPAGNAHEGHIYSSRLISPDTWTEAEKK